MVQEKISPKKIFKAVKIHKVANKEDMDFVQAV
jgi:hypothetical protein